jgi:hypothetical protein
VLWTVVVALLAVGLVELLRRPPAEGAEVAAGGDATVDSDAAVDGDATVDSDAAALDSDEEAALHRMDSARPAG